MVKDIMENNFEYSENQSLRNIIKKYSARIAAQEKIIEDLRGQLDSLSDPMEDVDVDALVDDLEQAQQFLSSVYHVACDAGLDQVEDLMSCADSCISEALDVLKNGT